MLKIFHSKNPYSRILTFLVREEDAHIKKVLETTSNYKPTNKTVQNYNPSHEARSSGDRLTSFAVSKEPRDKTTRKSITDPTRYPGSSCKIGACECGEP